MDIDWYDGDRAALRSLFEYAEDSAVQLDAYLSLGRVLVARHGSALVGHLQLVPTNSPDEIELKNMAVCPAQRGTGVGRALVEDAVRRCTRPGLAGPRAMTTTRTLPGQDTLLACWAALAQLSPGWLTAVPGAIAAVFPESAYLNNAILDGDDAEATVARLAALYTDAGVTSWAPWVPSPAVQFGGADQRAAVTGLTRDITTLVMHTPTCHRRCGAIPMSSGHPSRTSNDSTSARPFRPTRTARTLR